MRTLITGGVKSGKSSHALALARLKELMRDAERYRKARSQNGYVMHADPDICDAEVDALAEGWR